MHVFFYASRNNIVYHSINFKNETKWTLLYFLPFVLRALKLFPLPHQQHSSYKWMSSQISLHPPQTLIYPTALKPKASLSVSLTRTFNHCKTETYEQHLLNMICCLHPAWIICPVLMNTSRALETEKTTATKKSLSQNSWIWHALLSTMSQKFSFSSSSQLLERADGWTGWSKSSPAIALRCTNLQSSLVSAELLFQWWFIAVHGSGLLLLLSGHFCDYSGFLS